MKKLLSVGLSLVLALSFVGCSKQQNQPKQSEKRIQKLLRQRQRRRRMQRRLQVVKKTSKILRGRRLYSYLN